MILKYIVYASFLYLTVEVSVVLSSSAAVPVTIWKEGSVDEKSWTFDAEDSGKLTAREFGKIINKQLTGEKKVLVFLQDTLSLEDISEFEDSSPYQNLASKVNEDNFLYFPAVSQPEKGLSHLKNWKKFDVLADDEGDVLKHLRKPEPVIVYVHLPKTAKEEYRAGTLEKNDETMNNIITAAVKSVGDVVVIFTGETSSVRVRREAPASRRLLAEKEDQKATSTAAAALVSYNSSCVLFYVGNITLREKNGTKEYLSKPEVSSTCANGTETTMSMKWTGTSQGDLNLEIKFKGASGKDWSVSSLQLIATKGGSQVSNNTYKTKELYAPKLFSYSCGGPVQFKPTKNGSLILDFVNLQMQPLFGTASSEGFGRAYDCTGFFTVPILAGVLVSLMFAVIMYWALSMVMSIQTMDQFDDPKGPSISVPQGD